MISVCMASCNGEQFILEQVQSILSQLGTCDELIISDDGSTDQTLAIIGRIKDRRIRLFQQSGQLGPKTNFSKALSQANGDLIFLADQDDVWEQDKLRVMSAYLKKYHLVISDCVVIDHEGTVLYDSFFRLRGSGKGAFRNLLANTYMGCCMGFRKTLLEKAMPFPVTAPMHDWWLGLVAEATSSVYFCPDKLVRYRRHRLNVTSLAGQSRFSFLKKLRFRVDLVRELLRMYGVRTFFGFSG